MFNIFLSIFAPADDSVIFAWLVSVQVSVLEVRMSSSLVPSSSLNVPLNVSRCLANIVQPAVILL